MQKLLAQIMKFGVVGVIATVIDFGIMNLLHYGLGLNILIANTSGFIISLIFNYLASMKYVFAHKEGMSRRREFIIFVVLSVIGLVLNDGIVLALNAGSGLEANIAKICATALVMVYNFVTRKIFWRATRQNSSKPLQHYGAHGRRALSAVSSVGVARLRANFQRLRISS